jgi:hypothetical protein
LRLAESEFGSETVGGRAAVLKSLFDSAAESEADAIQIARDAGFVFSQLSANFGQGLLLCVVEAQTLFIARIKPSDTHFESANEKRGVTVAMRVGRRNGNGVRDFLGELSTRRPGSIVIEGFEAPARADGINVALGENGAEPGLKRTASVEIAEKRALAAGAISESIELGKERIGEFARFRRSRATTENRSGGGAKVGAILGDEMLPRRFGIFHASGG